MTLRARRVANRLAEETGIAVPIALSILLVATILAGVAMTVAINTNAFSNRDTRSKRALEAADAGIRTALYRLNMYRPDAIVLNLSQAIDCPTVPTAQQAGSSGLCPMDGPSNDTAANLGNGAQYEYWISRVLQSGDKCAGTTVENDQFNVDQRCVTSVGLINNVPLARVQQRVAAYSPTAIFPVAILGKNSVTINNNATITSSTSDPALLGTNGQLTVGGVGGGTTLIDGYSLPPGAATPQIGSNVTNLGPTTPTPNPYPVPPVDPGSTSENTKAPYNNATTFQNGTCSMPASWPTPSTWVQTNCNYRLLGTCGSTCNDTVNGKNFDFQPAARTLWIGNNTSVVLSGGWYNLCSLYIGNNSQITLGPQATTIYIDSPSDPNSGSFTDPTNPPCSSSNSDKGVPPGSFTMQQGSQFNQGGSALNLHIFVYGNPSAPPAGSTNPSCSGGPAAYTVCLEGVSNSAFALAAPYSNVDLEPDNNVTFKGAITGYNVTIGNKSHFTYEADTDGLQYGALKLYYRTYWEQCPTTSFSPSAPTAGC